MKIQTASHIKTKKRFIWIKIGNMQIMQRLHPDMLSFTRRKRIAKASSLESMPDTEPAM